MSCNLYDILLLFYFLFCAILDFVSKELTREDPPELGHIRRLLCSQLSLKIVPIWIIVT